MASVFDNVLVNTILKKRSICTHLYETFLQSVFSVPPGESMPSDPFQDLIQQLPGRAGEMGLGPGGNRPGEGPPFEHSEGPPSAERALSSVQRALSTIQRALLSAQRALLSAQRALLSAQRALSSTERALSSA